jgi:hypothetical protein
VSSEREGEFRKREREHAIWRESLPKDPRDGAFYELNKRKRSTFTKDELDIYLSYVEKMIVYVGRAESILQTWKDLKSDLEKQRRQMA